MDTKCLHAPVIHDGFLKPSCFPEFTLPVRGKGAQQCMASTAHPEPSPSHAGRGARSTHCGDCRVLQTQTRGGGSLPFLWVWSHPFFNSPPTNFSYLAPLKIIITGSSVMRLLKLTMLQRERHPLYTKFMLVSSPFHCLNSDETTRSMTHLGTLWYIYHRNILAKRPSQTFLMPPLKPEPCKLNDEDDQEFECLQKPGGQGCQQRKGCCRLEVWVCSSSFDIFLFGSGLPCLFLAGPVLREERIHCFEWKSELQGKGGLS